MCDALSGSKPLSACDRNPVIERTIETIQSALPFWFELIGISFLSAGMKDKYAKLLQERIDVLGFEETV